MEEEFEEEDTTVFYIPATEEEHRRVFCLELATRHVEPGKAVEQALKYENYLKGHKAPILKLHKK